jgi:hypothetical protein
MPHLENQEGLVHSETRKEINKRDNSKHIHIVII